MGYRVSYTGPVMDEILNKSNKFEANDESWVIIPAGKSSLELSDLLHEGNYVYSGDIFFPTGTPLYETKVNYSNATFSFSGFITVRRINNNYYQYLHMTNFTNTVSTIVLVWIRQADYTYTVKNYVLNQESEVFLNFSDSKMVNKFDNQLRYFKDTKKFQYYDLMNQVYKDYIQNTMPKSVYGTITNVFETIDKTLNNAYHNDLAKEHVKDSSIHLSTTEKAAIDSKATKEYVTEKLDALSTTIDSEITPLLTPIKKIITDSLSTISTDKTSLETHEADAIKHPTEAKRTSWDSKADDNHTHTSSQIKISTSDVTGVIPAARIPNTAKEIQVSVANQTALLALTSSKVQNGDWVLVTTDPIEYYVVVDQTKLKTMAAFQKLSPDEISVDKKTWDNVQNKPSTLKDIIGDEYISSSEVSKSDKYVEAQSVESKTETNLNTATKKLDYISDDYMDYVVNTETLIDLIDYKIKIIKDILKNK